MCEALLVSRSGYYDWKKRSQKPGPRQMENAYLRQRIREEFAHSRRTYGSPRVHADLRAQDERVSRKRVARLMRQESLRARVRRRYKCTTMSEHDQPIAPNLLALSRVAVYDLHP